MRFFSFFVSGNQWQALLLLCAMAALTGGMGYVIAGASGFVWALMFALMVMAFMPRLSADMIARMYKARKLRPQDSPLLYSVVQDMAARLGLENVPVLHYMPSQVANAFTVGNGDRLSIVLSSELVDRLSFRELTGVLAHEISHIAHGDVNVMTMADVMSRITAFFSTVGKLLLLLNLPLLLTGELTIPWVLILLLLFAPSISVLMQLALSRGREFEADRMAVFLTRDPQGLASALRKIERNQKGMAGLLLSPDKHVEAPSFLRTHPATDDRITQLDAMAEEMQTAVPRYAVAEEEWRPTGHRSIVPAKQRSWRGWW